MKKILFLILSNILFHSILFAVPNIQKFNFHKVKIIVTETAGENSMINSKTEVFINGKRIEQIEFKNIEPLGGIAGVQKNPTQYTEDLFYLRKSGDYDSRVIGVSKKGKIFNFPDGFVFKDKKALYFLRKDGSEMAERSIFYFDTQKLEEFKPLLPLESKSMKGWDFSKKKWISYKEMLRFIESFNE